MRERDKARLGYCRKVFLPTWERWTDGNPTMRRLLECYDADAARQEARLRAFVGVTGELRKRHGEDPGVSAALLAASACFKAYIGVPEAAWREAVEQALAADQGAGAPGAG